MEVSWATTATGGSRQRAPAAAVLFHRRNAAYGDVTPQFRSELGRAPVRKKRHLNLATNSRIGIRQSRQRPGARTDDPRGGTSPTTIRWHIGDPFVRIRLLLLDYLRVEDHREQPFCDCAPGGKRRGSERPAPARLGSDL